MRPDGTYFDSAFDRDNDEIPRHYWQAPHANGHVSARREDVLGPDFPTAGPSSSLCVRYWLVTHKERVFKTGARRDTPELRVELGARDSSACPNKSARSSAGSYRARGAPGFAPAVPSGESEVRADARGREALSRPHGWHERVAVCSATRSKIASPRVEPAPSPPDGCPALRLTEEQGRALPAAGGLVLEERRSQPRRSGDKENDSGDLPRRRELFGGRAPADAARLNGRESAAHRGGLSGGRRAGGGGLGPRPGCRGRLRGRR